jgi:hypothetical protein
MSTRALAHGLEAFGLDRHQDAHLAGTPPGVSILTSVSAYGEPP